MTASDDEAEIRTLLTTWAAAVEAENLEGIVAGHSEDIVMFDVPAPGEIHGIDAYRQSWVDMFGWFLGTGKFRLDNLVVAAGGAVAFAHGRLRCRGAQDLNERDLSIRLTVGLRKIDGKWLVVHEHHSEASSGQR
jgi:ketosteroid isomerase-like protein